MELAVGSSDDYDATNNIHVGIGVMDLDIMHEEVLGEGECGKVMLARTHIGHQEVAVKEMRAIKALKAWGLSTKEWSDREQQLMQKLQHTSIVKTLGVCAEGEYLFLVMEFCSGGTLFDRILTRGHLTEENARMPIRQLLEAVDYCHNQGVFHNDINLENMLLDQDGNLKLSDFETALFGASSDALVTVSSEASVYSYTAPEIVFHPNTPYKAAAADIWSCGASLFYMLTGDYPFDWEGDTASTEDDVQAFTLPQQMSSTVQDLLRGCMELQPDLRMTAREILGHAWLAAW